MAGRTGYQHGAEDVGNLIGKLFAGSIITWPKESNFQMRFIILLREVIYREDKDERQWQMILAKTGSVPSLQYFCV